MQNANLKENNLIDRIDPTGRTALENDSTANLVDDRFEKYFKPIPLKLFKDHNRETCGVIYMQRGMDVNEEYRRILDVYVDKMERDKEAYEPNSEEQFQHKTNVRTLTYNRVQIKDRPKNFQYDVSEKYDSYINAQYIYNMYYKEPNNKPLFIATQAPTQKSYGHFWRMVWQENTRIILMLCQKIPEHCVENDRYYFPENEQALYYSDLVVEFKHLDEENSFVKKRTIKITNKVNKEARIITHYAVDGWPDLSIPSDSNFQDFKNMIEDIIQKRDEKEEKLGKQVKSPIVVHCRAGVGRTGTFIAIFEQVRLIKTYQKYFKPQSNIEQTNLGISIMGTFRCLREQRRTSIETERQYSYVYKFMKDYIDEIYV